MNKTSSQPNLETTSINLKKTMQQYLKALGSAGVETLPHGSGAVLFASTIFNESASTDSGSRVIAKSGANVQAKPTSSTMIKTSARPDQSNVDRPVAEVAQVAEVVSPFSQSPSRSSETSSTKQIAASANFSLSGSGLPLSERYSASLSIRDRQSQLLVLQNAVAECTLCAELVANRTQTVFGIGNVTPRLVFVGEGPGFDEDRVGEPFVGAAGKLLDKIMAASKIKRDDVYILNTVKCRPPNNRNPSQEELDHCWGYAEQQLEILQPEFIVCLGAVAAKRLLNTEVPLGRLRQKFHDYRGSQVLVTYHPAYLLRTESAKKYVWEDMQMLMKAMGLGLSK